MESAKWVGSVRIAFDGTVAAINEALIRPLIVNEMLQRRLDAAGAPSFASWRDA